jgi:hypothetical protein
MKELKRKSRRSLSLMPLIDQKTVCGICSCPRYIEYQERNEDTNLYETRVHRVECVGHLGVLPYLWNKSPEYDMYQKFFARQRMNSK